MNIPIYETENFFIQAAARPFIDRGEGGHVYIFPKVPVRDRTQLSPKLAVEYTKLSMVVGEALKSAMARQGVDIGIVNYQDMGNWGVFKPEGPNLHMQIYGRATTATIQSYGDAVQLPHRETGFYDNFKPLNKEDIQEIRADIEKLLKSDKYKGAWSEVKLNRQNNFMTMNTASTAKTILCYGDSNTWGQKPDKTGRYPANVRWTGLLQKRLGEEYYIIEEGLSSRTTNLDYSRKPGRNGKTYLEPCLDSHRPLDLVIVMLGTNDLKIEFARNAESIAGAIKELVLLIQDKTKSDKGQPAKILLVSPILVDDTATDFYKFYTGYYDHESAVKSRRLATEIELVAKQTGSFFADAALVSQAGEDGIHFNEEAHRGLGELLFEKVRDEVLAK